MQSVNGSVFDKFISICLEIIPEVTIFQIQFKDLSVFLFGVRICSSDLSIIQCLVKFTLHIEQHTHTENLNKLDFDKNFNYQNICKI